MGAERQVQPMRSSGVVEARADTLLIVDDVPANLAVAIAHLEDQGFDVAVAQEGEEALERAELLQPDLILLDVLLTPAMDGFETCRRLKAADATREIPVIFMTALADTADKVAGFEAGGVDYVTKPFQLDEVVARIRTHVAMHAMRRKIAAQNAQLLQEIATRERFESALRRAHDELERRVAERTAELAEANVTLKAEIAERERAEAEREALLASEQAARSKAEAADRLKDEFLTALSHELRTPLTAIVGWAQLLRTGMLDAATMQRGFDVIERNSWAELQVIEDLLDVSALVSGKMTLQAQPVRLATVVRAAFDGLKVAADAKGVSVSMALSPRDGKVWGDGSRLQQVVWNLLSNAIKFTPPGGNVAVSLEQIDSVAQIRVSDTGEGISEAFLPHVFERFRQADSAVLRQRGGLGLGLSIVRHLVEMHGGTVRGESDGVGKGATFTVHLPLMPAAEEAAVPARAGAREGGEGACSPALSGLRVLVIDDEPDMRELMTSILERTGAEVRAAATAWEGFEMVEPWRPHVIVSDIGLPGDDGYALIRKIRALPVDRGGKTPAVALTARAGQHAREQTLSEGFEVHVSKPVEPSALIDVIARLASGRVHGDSPS
ncbi:uncharacterized protein SOCE26_032530 [Sorangium cellulosum]|uniref:histidine kinase n=1 Tax=Sorangium cellulosum TaxID=56 RepID=A0A2L0ER81_SORCE|nr:uncharacterized protein SOCE26_032530 [Sorangium cellulosum]